MKKSLIVIPFVVVLLMGVLFLIKAIPKPEKKTVGDWAVYYAKECFFSIRDDNEPYLYVINKMELEQQRENYEVYYVVITDSEGDFEEYLVSIEYEYPKILRAFDNFFGGYGFIAEKQIINYKVEKKK